MIKCAPADDLKLETLHSESTSRTEIEDAVVWSVSCYTTLSKVEH